MRLGSGCSRSECIQVNVQIAARLEPLCRRKYARFLCRRMVTNCVLEMKSISSHCILLVWILCCCLQCDSARIIGDGKYFRNTGDQLQDDVLQCNNTVQGRYLLSDSRGYVCSNMEVSPATACCPEGGEQYSCQGCNMVTQCCDSYEYCVSCCLNPMRTALEMAIKTKLARQATAGLCTSLFDYCSGRCRHNSESVVHENAYVSGEHHCFATQSASPGDPVDTGATTELGDVSILVGRQGLSCDTTCSAKKLSCREDKLAAINNCAELQKYNKCKGLCIASSGPDQPAEVVNGAPKYMHPGACLFNSQASQLSCKGYHPFTRRLCPCA